MQSNGDSIMEKFEKPELLNFLCEPDFDIGTASPNDEGYTGDEVE